MVEGGAAQAAVAEGTRPSRHPERRQVLSVAAVHPQGRHGWFIPFAKEGGRVILGAVKESKGMDLGGGIPDALGGEEG